MQRRYLVHEAVVGDGSLVRTFVRVQETCGRTPDVPKLILSSISAVGDDGYNGSSLFVENITNSFRNIEFDTTLARHIYA